MSQHVSCCTALHCTGWVLCTAAVDEVDLWLLGTSFSKTCICRSEAQEVCCLGCLQEPLNLYRAAMSGIRKHLVRHVYDGTADMSFVSEATINKGSGVIGPANDRFEHLTCFAGGMFVLGECIHSAFAWHCCCRPLQLGISYWL